MKKIPISINHKQYQVPEGITVLEACLTVGIDIPHFCRHPALEIVGNCRLCLVKIMGQPKLVISCAMTVVEDMEIITDDEDVRKAREMVMELYLLNHPLDCPICDQAGECYLQDYSFDHGMQRSRLKEPKEHKANKQLGKHIYYFAERCVMCTRCIRFTRDVSGTHELNVYKRGNKNIIDIFPGMEINNPLSGNVADICPVGSLVTTDFMYTIMPWYLKRTYSYCQDCSNVCDIEVDSYQHIIRRIISRENSKRKQYFICDYGRFNLEYIHHENRLHNPQIKGEMVSYKKLFAQVAKRLQSPSSMILVSLFQNNETLFLIRQLSKILKNVNIYVFGQDTIEDEVFPQFTIRGDKNPNRQGASLILGKDKILTQTDKLAKVVAEKKPQTVMVIGGIPNFVYPQAFLDALNSVEEIIAVEHSKNNLTIKAGTLIPSLSYTEKCGTLLSEDGFLLRYDQAIPPVSLGMAETEILQNIISRVKGTGDSVVSIQSVYQDMANSIKEFNDISFDSLIKEGFPVLKNQKKQVMK